jgi:hypothetical protein
MIEPTYNSILSLHYKHSYFRFLALERCMPGMNEPWNDVHLKAHLNQNQP